MNREHFTDTQSALTLPVISSATHTHTLDACCLVHGSHQLEDTSGQCRGSGQTVFILRAERSRKREGVGLQMGPLDRATQVSTTVSCRWQCW